MTLSALWSLQQQIYEAAVAAAEGLPVTTSPSPQARYVRLDGWGTVNDFLHKNQESATHRFFLHVFDAPAGGTNSLAWTKQKLSSIDAAMRAAIKNLVYEDAQVVFEPRSDEGYNAHGFIRYRVQLGG